MKINSRICSVKELFDGKTRYIVPSYNETYKYLRTCDDARGILLSITQNYQSGEEQCFAGTIMLSDKNEIIDGCLRLQCLSIFLKELSFLFPNNERLKSLIFDWLETKVSSEEMKNLSRYFSCKSSDETDGQDESFGEIAIFLRQNLADLDLFKGKTIDSEDFIGYLFNNVIFNIIEVEDISLWDPSYISNTLNTPYRSLGFSDMFCQSLLGYLTEKKGDE